MPLKSVPLILCSCQRSGTVALTEALSASGMVTNFYEIFHGDMNLVASGFYYWLKNISSDKNSVHTDYCAAERMFMEYLEYLDQLHDKPYMIIDIKYDQWCNVSHNAHNIFYPPLLMQLFKKNKMPIIHLLRKNTFLNYLSTVYAAQTGKWHYRGQKPEAEENRRIAIDPVQCQQYIIAIEGYKEMYRRFLRPYPHKAEIFYESSFDESGLSAIAKSKLGSVLPQQLVNGSRLNTFKSPYDARDVVSNKAELLAYFYNTPHEWMLLEALS